MRMLLHYCCPRFKFIQEIYKIREADISWTWELENGEKIAIDAYSMHESQAHSKSCDSGLCKGIKAFSYFSK